MTPPTALPRAYQLKISLIDSDPEIWRQVVVPAQIKLSDLHQVIQLAMGWENIHEHAFDTGLGSQRVRHEASLLLADVIVPERSLYYTYDFESGWLHRITLEALEAHSLAEGNADPVGSEVLPTCTDGAMACPPEGTGGVWGYDDFLDRLEDSEDPDYLMLIEKYGTFDPDVFDVKAAAARLEAQPLRLMTSA